MQIPFLDLVTSHIQLEEELVAVFRESLRKASFVGGPQVESFETAFAQFCDTKYCVAVNSGTDALRFSLIAAGIGPGDEVVTVPNTFIATTEAISQAGAKPVFVDIDRNTYNMDPERLSERLSAKKSQGSPQARVRAVIPVHLYGQPANMDAILEIAQQNDLIVIEDACQAHGASYFSGEEKRWRKAGSMGLAGAFSFYPGKNLGACGEGGAVTTNDEGIAQKVKMLRDHGQRQKYHHTMEGYNGRLDSIQAGILRVKLKHLETWNEKRRESARLYDELLHGIDHVICPYEPSWAKAVYHLYVIRCSKRNELQQYLTERNIGSGLHYPIPLHLQESYNNLGYRRGDFPMSEECASEILSLPMFPGLTIEQQEYVVSAISEFVTNGR